MSVQRRAVDLSMSDVSHVLGGWSKRIGTSEKEGAGNGVFCCLRSCTFDSTMNELVHGCYSPPFCMARTKLTSSCFSPCSTILSRLHPFLPLPQTPPVKFYSSISSPPLPSAPPPPGILPSFNSFSKREISCKLLALRIRVSTRLRSLSVSLTR